MLEILISWINPLRAIGIWLDEIVFSLVDNAYNLIVVFSKGTMLSQETIRTIMNNMYVVIGIFALFRIAMLLVNAVINPDKLSEKGNGIPKILTNFVIMFVILVFTPFVFEKALELQELVVKNHYVEKLFINTDTAYGKDGEPKKNPGKTMRDIVIGSLITINEEADNLASCDEGSECRNAINAYHEMEKTGFSIPRISRWIGVSIKNDDGEVVYVYNYTFLVTFIAGGFIVYILLSFAIDIAVRMVELSVLEVIAPLFIATYIDPKSAKSGPFNKWLKTVGKTYASLFIKLAIVALMLLLVSLIGKANLNESVMGEIGGFANVVLLFAILIFAKKAPKWIGDMIGVGGDAGLGGLGIGKKLAGAALIGGAATALSKHGKQKGKNFMGNRVRNTAARLGGMKEAFAENRRLNKAGTLTNDNKQSIWKQGSRAAQRSRNDNLFKNTEGILKGATAGYMAGRMNVNGNAESLKDAYINKQKGKLAEYEEKMGLNSNKIKEIKDNAKKEHKAKILHGNVQYKNGERNKELSYQGNIETNVALRNKFKDASGNVVNRVPQTEFEGYLADMLNNGRLNNVEMDANGIIQSVTRTDGTILHAANPSEMKLVRQMVTDHKNAIPQPGQDANKLTFAQNLQSTQKEYYEAKDKVKEFEVGLSESRTNLVMAATDHNSTIQRMAAVTVTNSTSFVDSTGRNVVINEKNAGKLMQMYETAADPLAKAAIQATLTTSCPNEFLIANNSNQNMQSLENAIKTAENQLKAWTKVSEDKANIMKSVSDQYIGGKGFEPKDNVLAIEVNGEYLTPFGKYTKNSRDEWQYTPGSNTTISKEKFISETDSKVSKLSTDADNSYNEAEKKVKTNKKGMINYERIFNCG